MSRRPRELARMYRDALALEKQVSLELAKALQAQFEINEFLRNRLNELEKEG